jgi:hypothetical protein
MIHQTRLEPFLVSVSLYRCEVSWNYDVHDILLSRKGLDLDKKIVMGREGCCCF